MLWAACTAVFFGLLRASEFTAPSNSSASPSTLLFHHVSVIRDLPRVRLYLPMSKTDQFASGACVYLFPQAQPVCPFTAVAAFSGVHPSGTGPFFSFASGKFLTRRDIATLLSSAFPDQPNLNSHSFRIGGASALAAAGVPDYQVRVLGRWSSDSFLRYIRLQPTTLRESQARMRSRDA